MSTPVSAPTAAPILRLHGSNAIAAALAPELVKKFMESEGATYTQTVSSGADESDLEFEKNRNQQKVEIVGETAATAFRDLAKGLCDIVMASSRSRRTRHSS